MTKTLSKEVIEARSSLILNVPFFASIMFERSVVEMADDDGTWRGIPVPTACTDGRHIVLNGSFFNPLPMQERIFTLAHEIFHLLARHTVRAKYYQGNTLHGEKYQPRLGNIAMDAVINKCLRDAGIGKQVPDTVDLTAELAQKGYTLTGTEAWEDVYKVLLEIQEDQQKQGGGQGKGDPLDGMGALSGDVMDPATAQGEIPSEAEMKASIKAAHDAAKAMGKLPGNLKSFVDEFLEPVIPWQEKLQNLIVSRVNPDHYSWNRLNRHRLMLPGVMMPRLTGHSIGPIAITIDSSGSMSDHNIRECMTEAASILTECNPEKIYVIWCDAQVDRVDEIETPEELLEITRAEGVPGRGGTSFIPPFEYLAKMDDPPEIHIYMTDGYGPFPREEQGVGHTIWLINNKQVTPPFGDHIVLDT